MKELEARRAWEASDEGRAFHEEFARLHFAHFAAHCRPWADTPAEEIRRRVGDWLNRQNETLRGLGVDAVAPSDLAALIEEAAGRVLGLSVGEWGQCLTRAGISPELRMRA